MYVNNKSLSYKKNQTNSKFTKNSENSDFNKIVELNDENHKQNLKIMEKYFACLTNGENDKDKESNNKDKEEFNRFIEYYNKIKSEIEEESKKIDVTV